MLRVDGSREIRAAVLAFRAADRDTRRIIRQDTVSAFRADWKADVRAAASRAEAVYPYPRMLRSGVNFAGGNPPEVSAYTSTRALPGGLVPSYRWRGAEFGTNRRQFITRTYTSRSRRGRSYTVRERHTARQQPPERDTGHVVWPVFMEYAPRVVTYWVASIVRAYAQAAGAERG